MVCLKKVDNCSSFAPVAHQKAKEEEEKKQKKSNLKHKMFITIAEIYLLVGRRLALTGRSLIFDVNIEIRWKGRLPLLQRLYHSRNMLG